MSLRANDAYAHIRHALGGGDLDPSLDALGVVNQAGEYLYSMHPWAFTRRRSALVDTVADQDYVDLPTDFRSIIAITQTDGTLYDIQLVSLEEVQRARTSQANIGSSWNYLGAITWAGAPPVPILELWPTPSTSTTGIFTCTYKKGWPRVTNDSDALDFPEFMDALYIQIVRAMAKGYELDGAEPREVLLARITMGPEMRAAKERDAAVQWNRGRIRGGGSQVFGRSSVATGFTPWIIQGPS